MVVVSDKYKMHIIDTLQKTQQSKNYDIKSVTVTVLQASTLAQYVSMHGLLCFVVREYVYWSVCKWYHETLFKN